MIWSLFYSVIVNICSLFMEKVRCNKRGYWLMAVILVLKGLRQNDLELRLSRAMY